VEKSKVNRLNVIVSVRDDQKKKTTRELTQIIREKNIEIEHLDFLTHERNTMFQKHLQGIRLKADRTQTDSAFIKQLSTDIQQQKETIRKITVKEDLKRDELIARVKAKNVVDKLQEKFVEEERKESDRKEQHLTDSLNQRLRIEQ
jgi:flagellar export protein FliJ